MKRDKNSVWANEWMLWKLAWKEAPLYMAIMVFECIRFDVFVFLEHTLAIWYVLNAAETGQPFRKVVLAMVTLIGMLLVSHLIQSVYHQWALPKMKPVLYQALRRQIYERAVSQDLADYDDPEYYNDFILATKEADKCIDRFLNITGPGISTVTGFVLQTVFLGVMNASSFFFVALAMTVTLLSFEKLNKLEVQMRLEQNVPQRRRDYVHRVFYLHDYAKELRLNKEFDAVLYEDYNKANDELQAINRAYGKKRWFWFVMSNYIRYFIIDFLFTGFMIYQTIYLDRYSISMMITLVHAASAMTGRGIKVAGFYPQLAENGAFVDKIRAFLARKPQLKSRRQLPLPGEAGVLKLEHVSFSYDKEQVLADINMEIRPGQKIALVGYNGAGKSTLVKLIMRLYDPTEGRILLNGVDIRDYELEAYRRYIGVVFQDFKIYAATLKENVVMDQCGRDREQDYQVENALFDARFTLEAKELKYQIETPLTTEFEKDGVNLSGGESQKVAIARVLYRKQNLIIMDEPSSALDPIAEYQLNTAMNEIAEDKTVIFISHRLSTTRDADCIYMMEQGRIIEEGSHRRLLAANGAYARMWNAQAGKYNH